jgi:hypothetical protein
MTNFHHFKLMPPISNNHGRAGHPYEWRKLRVPVTLGASPGVIEDLIRMSNRKVHGITGETELVAFARKLNLAAMAKTN